MVCLEPVDDRADFRVGRAQLGEERMVLGVVVGVDEAAVAQAVDPQPPEEAVSPELVELLL